MSNPKKTQDKSFVESGKTMSDDHLLDALDQIVGERKGKKETTDSNKNESTCSILNEILGEIIRDCKKIRVVANIIDWLFGDDTTNNHGGDQ